MIYIYTLSHPLTKEVKYVGRTKDLRNRYNGHCSKSKATTPVKIWVQSLIAAGMKPIIEEIDFVPQEECKYWEHYWCSQLTTWGFNLANEKGNLGCEIDGITKSSRNKISETLTGRNNNWQTNNKAVNQYSLDGLFIKRWGSVMAASKDTNITHSSILKAATGIAGQTMGGGFMWRHCDNADNIPPFKPRDYAQIYKAVEKIKRPIACYDFEGNKVNEFISMTEACKWLCVPKAQTTIRMNIRGKYNSAYGYTWKDCEVTKTA